MKINLTNPFIFWTIVILTTIGIFIYNFNNNVYTNNIKQQNVIEEQSLSTDTLHKDTNYIVDLDKIDSAKTEQDLLTNNVDELSLTSKIENSATDNLFTLVYATFMSILFVFREKQNHSKIVRLEKVEDDLNIQLAKQNTTVYKDISNELKKFEDIVKYDLNISLLDERIEHEPKYIVIASKNILEQIITKMYKKYLNLENANLNIMLGDLYKKRTLNHNLNNYAHIIKAFGNKANHTSKIFDSREATLAISNLIEFLKELENKNILRELND